MNAISQLGTLGDVLDYLVERGLKASEADHLVKLVLEFGIEAAKVRKGQRAKPVRNTEPKVECGFPDDLVLSEPLIAYAGRNGFVGQRVIDMWEDFHNHHRRKGSRFVDWHAAWFTWVRNQVKFQARDNDTANRSPLI